jgi:lipoprotein-anchoring transpeptidase ErfK/SrfK
MIRTLALPFALVALAASPFSAAAQSSAGDAAEAAQLVTARADVAFERVDPDSEMPTTDEAALTYAGLPPLVPETDVALEEPVRIVDPAPRGPAVREIAMPVVQPLPAQDTALAPTPVALASNDPFVIKSILPIEGTIRYGDWFWDESAAPRSGKLVITVDLEARVISAFRDGHEIGTAVVLVGTQDHPTPLGSFPILTKEKDNVSEKYDNAPMPWTLRLTWDGIAIHGSPVLNGYASHGCIGVPDDFAAKLFAAAKRGDKVIITRGRMIGLGDKVM